MHSTTVRQQCTTAFNMQHKMAQTSFYCFWMQTWLCLLLFLTDVLLLQKEEKACTLLYPSGTSCSQS